MLRSNSAKAQVIWNMRLAGRRGRVDHLLVRGGIDAACCERLHGAEQIDQRPPKPIDGPSSLDCAIGNAAFMGRPLPSPACRSPPALQPNAMPLLKLAPALNP
jgi:hypothetical protein